MAMEPNFGAGMVERAPRKDPIGVRRAAAMMTVLLISDGFNASKIASASRLALAFVGSRNQPIGGFGTGLALLFTAESSEIWFKARAASLRRFG